jgi:hypothetical protein
LAGCADSNDDVRAADRHGGALAASVATRPWEKTVIRWTGHRCERARTGVSQGYPRRQGQGDRLLTKLTVLASLSFQSPIGPGPLWSAFLTLLPAYVTAGAWRHYRSHPYDREALFRRLLLIIGGCLIMTTVGVWNLLGWLSATAGQ